MTSSIALAARAQPLAPSSNIPPKLLPISLNDLPIWSFTSPNHAPGPSLNSFSAAMFSPPKGIMSITSPMFSTRGFRKSPSPPHPCASASVTIAAFTFGSVTLMPVVSPFKPDKSSPIDSKLPALKSSYFWVSLSQSGKISALVSGQPMPPVSPCGSANSRLLSVTGP